MKKRNLNLLNALFITLFLCHNVNAQSAKEETDLYQSIFGMEKKAIVADFIGVDSADPFWVLYDEYETKRKELGKDRINALMNYVDNYDGLDDTTYDTTIKKMIALRDGHDKLMDQYYKKVKKASGAKVAAQFFQLEGFFLSEIRSAIFEEIPFIGELNN
ncbi:hypothetical protein [Gelidibacter japonicus]|uniref:hypothetical protein n=1 Tax=Gelidibacter japonicus TaxID=1962232 RepID=UPI0013D554E8|nr:hypothetical protein [Gelidibacter japonicus]